MHYYFANTDLDVAHTLARRFFWTENVLWKEELEGRRVTAVLGSEDIIVDTEEVGRYLTRESDGVGAGNGEEGEAGEVTAMMDKRDDGWKEREWTGKKGVEVVWMEGCDHAQEFYRKRERDRIVDVLVEYCKRGEDI